MKRSLIATAFVIGIATNVQAHTYHHRHHVHPMVEGLGVGLRHMLDSMGPRPHAWCGYYMRQVFGVADSAYNLARNWSHYGRPASGPGVGVIVVWPHHVSLIVGRTDNGLWITKGGNEGGRVMERPRSLAGAIAFRIP